MILNSMDIDKDIAQELKKELKKINQNNQVSFKKMKNMVKLGTITVTLSEDHGVTESMQLVKQYREDYAI